MRVSPSTSSHDSPDGTFKEALDALYHHFNQFEHIHPDPLEFVHLYHDGQDRELTGMVASALAYGRVGQILCSARSVLDAMGPSPAAFVLQNTPADFRHAFRDFKHRFTTGDMLAALLKGVRRMLLEYGSLEACFLSGFHKTDGTILPALSEFVQKLESAAGQKMSMFLPSPTGGSACKRLNLFLRWMVRHDNVDPGVWKHVPPSHLVVPLDTHMHRIALVLGLSTRKQADIRCAVEVTKSFGALQPEDPVRYDFALTRLGMNNLFPRIEDLAGHGFDRNYQNCSTIRLETLMTDSNVKLFALSTCIHCRNTKEFLDGCGIKYDCVDVDKLQGEERQKVIEEMKLSNPSCAFPMLIIGEKVIIGFRQDEIKEALNLS